MFYHVLAANKIQWIADRWHSSNRNFTQKEKIWSCMTETENSGCHNKGRSSRACLTYKHKFTISWLKQNTTGETLKK